MLISKKWLSEFVKLPREVTDEEISKKLTHAVVEVEDVIDQSQSYKNMVVGLVEKTEQHPGADRLKVCEVDVGDHKANIVCGGTNVVQGMKVAVALPGAKVKWHGEGELITLEKTKIRGIESEGMICTGAEIGMGKITDEEKEIMDLSEYGDAPGTSLSKVFGFDDTIIEIEHKSLTHRPDLFGHFGIARELSALFRVPLNKYSPEKIREGKGIDLKVAVEDNKLCPRYMAVAIEGIEIAQSPNWLKQRIQSCGIRSINNIVDITNFVLLEIGQPMHVFDADKIGGNDVKILVRNAKNGESILGLDEKEYKLEKENLVITDTKNPIAIAGVVGGQESGVDENTKRIVFEAGNFQAGSIRKTSTKLSLRSESSARFEKALDQTMCELALARAVELVKQLCPNAKVVSQIVDTQKEKPKTVKILISPDFVNERLGTEISEKEMKEILERLEFEVSQRGKQFSIIVPSWRATKDIAIAEDLVEEIARIHGYDLIPSTLPIFKIVPPAIDRVRELKKLANEVLIEGFGASEIYSYAFTSSDTILKLGLSIDDHIKLSNPISEERPYLVWSLIPNLLECVLKNQRTQDGVLIFESDRVFLKDEKGEVSGEENNCLPLQPHHFAVVFSQKGIDEPFWQMKKIVLQILNACGFDCEFKESASVESWQHNGRSASIIINGKIIGNVCEVDPIKANAFGIDYRTSAMEINLDELSKIEPDFVSYKALSVHPSIFRDLAFVIADRTTYDSISQSIKNISQFIVSTELFDVYRGKNVGEGKKSLAIHVEFSAKDRTMESKEADEVVLKISKMLKKDFGAIMRV